MKTLLALTLLLSTALSNACLIKIDDKQYQAEINSNQVIINGNIIPFQFERKKILDDGSSEYHYISQLAAQLTEDYLYLLTDNIGMSLNEFMGYFSVYAQDLIDNDPKSDLIDSDYRLHGYIEHLGEITVVLCPSDNPGVMFSQIRVQCL